MNKEEKKIIVQKLLPAFIDGGNVSIKLRKKGLIKNMKSDNTPVTNGDIEVNNILTKAIKTLTPNIPIISEETSENKNKINLSNFWLIDPIDGTYDYVNNGEEFTLNAALIINNKPSLGIINAPKKNRLFYSYDFGESYEINGKEKIKLDGKKKTNLNEVKAVSYSDNLKPEIIKIHEKYRVTSFTKMKSSLKFCVVAASDFDLYAAEARACEWDVAAGHAILLHAGGLINDFDGKEITYGKKDFKNTSIILRRSENL